VATGDDQTLDELRVALGPALADAAIFDGWTEQAVVNAAEAEGVDQVVAVYAFRDGAMARIAAWISSVDEAMAQAFAPGALAGVSIRERIRRLVQFRLDQLVGREEALRRALAIMAQPQNARQTLKLGWHSADAMWRTAGDAATDYNHYTKRATLAALYAATLAVFAYDESEARAETRAFLDRRIEDVMRFEKTKHQLLQSRGEGFSMARFLGRLRYPAR
jgi:ubiquinone biosynthesis protein COQ9